MPHSTPTLATQHDSLDARLSAAYLHAAWGLMDAARQEYDTFCEELERHLHESERLLFDALAGLDEREGALQRIEWKTHVRDLERIVLALRRELDAPTDAVLYELFGALRRAMRRHCRQDDRLVGAAARTAAVAGAARAADW